MAETCLCHVRGFEIVYCPLHEAAPELLELLKLVAHPKFIPDERGRVRYYLTRADVAAARKAIKKAETQR